MPAIFFDLETSDREPIGQILNFSFILIDDRWEIIRDYSASVRLSRLQLPSPGALLANRINILEHQATVELTEKGACQQIASFLSAAIEEFGKLPLIGYNSFRFDLLHLRTTLIRNGINPYFFGKLINRDLLTVVRKLSITRPDFPRAPSNEDASVLSLRLETISQELGLLKGRQLHSSRDDTLLTIAVARTLAERFDLDVRTFEPYEAGELHRGRQHGALRYHCDPQYDLKGEGIVRRTPKLLLDANHRYSLWVDLDRYRAGEGKRSLSLAKVGNGSCFIDPTPCEGEEIAKLATQAMGEFVSVTLDTFFTTSECDIEQDIYRIDMLGIEALRRAIWEGKREEVIKRQSRDLRTVYVRHLLANYQWGGSEDAAVRTRLREYALYRYGGRLITDRFYHSDSPEPPTTHPTLGALHHEVQTRLAAEIGEDDRSILTALQSYYSSSELFEIAGEDLLALEPPDPVTA